MVQVYPVRNIFVSKQRRVNIIYSAKPTIIAQMYGNYFKLYVVVFRCGFSQEIGHLPAKGCVTKLANPTVILMTPVPIAMCSIVNTDTTTAPSNPIQEAEIRCLSGYFNNHVGRHMRLLSSVSKCSSRYFVHFHVFIRIRLTR